MKVPAETDIFGYVGYVEAPPGVHGFAETRVGLKSEVLTLIVGAVGCWFNLT